MEKLAPVIAPPVNDFQYPIVDRLNTQHTQRQSDRIGTQREEGGREAVWETALLADDGRPNGMELNRWKDEQIDE